jgi:hypothetical protein
MFHILPDNWFNSRLNSCAVQERAHPQGGSGTAAVSVSPGSLNRRCVSFFVHLQKKTAQ